MIAILANDDLRQKSGRGDAALLQARGQGSDHWSKFRVPTWHVFATHQSAAQKPSGLVVELFADLRADQAPVLRSLLHFLGIDDLLNDGQIRRPSLPATGAPPGSYFMPRESLLQRGGVDFSRFVLRAHQKEIELAGVQLFARTAEHPPLDAYSLNNITAKKAVDGSVTVQFGGCDGKIPNCLPIMKGWNYMVRLYRPRAEILNGTWKFPEAQPVR